MHTIYDRKLKHTGYKVLNGMLSSDFLISRYRQGFGEKFSKRRIVDYVSVKIFFDNQIPFEIFTTPYFALLIFQHHLIHVIVQVHVINELHIIRTLNVHVPLDVHVNIFKRVLQNVSNIGQSASMHSQIFGWKMWKNINISRVEKCRMGGRIRMPHRLFYLETERSLIRRVRWFWPLSRKRSADWIRWWNTNQNSCLPPYRRVFAEFWNSYCLQSKLIQPWVLCNWVRMQEMCDICEY